MYLSILIIYNFLRRQLHTQSRATSSWKRLTKAQGYGPLNSGSFFDNFMSNKSERAEEVIELFKQAVTNYKLTKRWDDSAKAYIKCVECDKMCKRGQTVDFYQ